MLPVPADFDELNARIYKSCAEFTMTSPERVGALIEAVKYIVKEGVSGDIVECGVWKGGSAMAAVMALQEMGDEQRQIFLYDTYAGMSSPSHRDISIGGRSAQERFSELRTSEETSDWCLSPLSEVKSNVLSVGYPGERFHFIEGKVEDTIPGCVPDRIALLRLDTDWYESTKHELIHLFPRISPGGVIIIDDYGHWHGARQAVDEYISEHNVPIFLNRIDRSGRIGIKL
jgi:O-methyltransferase